MIKSHACRPSLRLPMFETDAPENNDRLGLRGPDLPSPDDLAITRADQCLPWVPCWER